MSIIAALSIIAVPALAQEATSPSTQNAPATDQMAPATPPAAPSVPAPSATEPAPAPSPTPPAADKQAAAPSGEIVIGELRKSEDDNKTVDALNATVDKVKEMDVYDANGKKIAEVDSVLEDKNGDVKGIAIEYGGFLGFGEKAAILTLDQVKQKDGTLVTEMSEEQLPALPAWTH
jgi:sporulation protein YlmC with PRC-barrel domain